MGQPVMVNHSTHFVLKDMFKHSTTSIDKACVVGIVNLASVPGASVPDVVIDTLSKLSNHHHVEEVRPPPLGSTTFQSC